MATPLSALTLESPSRAGRKRSRSSIEIFTLSPSYDTKRARIGIRELSTEDVLPREIAAAASSIPPIKSQNSPSDRLESRDDQEHSSSDLDSSTETTSTSSSSGDEDDESGAESRLEDEGYDTDSESGSTTSSSSSSSSDSADSDDGNAIGVDNSSRLATFEFPSPERSRTSAAMALPSTSTSNLAARLNSFLPQLRAANAKLEEDRDMGRLEERNIENVDENDRYIEMNLGLGVLEEKRGDESSHSSDNDGDEDEIGSTQSSTKHKTKKDAMAVLLGKRGAKKPAIEILE